MVVNREYFDVSWLSDLWKADGATSKFSSGQVTIVGGSSLFHGAPLLSLIAASRTVGMVYFSSFSEDKQVAERMKERLKSFVWVDRGDVGDYIAKSDAVLIGPGMMRSHANVHNPDLVDEVGAETREITLRLFREYPSNRWVVDGGSLQVIRPDDLPKGSVITPNAKEFRMLFGEDLSEDAGEMADQVFRKAKAYGIVIMQKGVEGVVSDGARVVYLPKVEIGVARGAVGDVIAGLTVGLLAKNEAVLAVCCAGFLVNGAIRRMHKKYGDMFNSDDLADAVAEYYGEVVGGD